MATVGKRVATYFGIERRNVSGAKNCRDPLSPEGALLGRFRFLRISHIGYHPGHERLLLKQDCEG